MTSDDYYYRHSFSKVTRQHIYQSESLVILNSMILGFYSSIEVGKWKVDQTRCNCLYSSSTRKFCSRNLPDNERQWCVS